MYQNLPGLPWTKWQHTQQSLPLSFPLIPFLSSASRNMPTPPKKGIKVCHDSPSLSDTLILCSSIHSVPSLNATASKGTPPHVCTKKWPCHLYNVFLKHLRVVSLLWLLRLWWPVMQGEQELISQCVLLSWMPSCKIHSFFSFPLHSGRLCW